MENHILSLPNNAFGTPTEIFSNSAKTGKAKNPTRSFCDFSEIINPFKIHQNTSSQLGIQSNSTSPALTDHYPPVFLIFNTQPHHIL